VKAELKVIGAAMARLLPLGVTVVDARAMLHSAVGKQIQKVLRLVVVEVAGALGVEGAVDEHEYTLEVGRALRR
jgi:hypothetical protein